MNLAHTETALKIPVADPFEYIFFDEEFNRQDLCLLRTL